MNVFDYVQPLWNHRFSHTFGVSGANYGTGSESRAGHSSTWGGAITAGSRSVHASASGGSVWCLARASGIVGSAPGERVWGRFTRARCDARGRLCSTSPYQACVRVQWGQPTEVVTGASNA